MDTTITGSFATRRAAELAIEHLVQAHEIARTDIFVQPAGRENSAGSKIAGADAESGHPGTKKQGAPKLQGDVEVSIACRARQSEVVKKALEEAGATHLRVQ
jgi:hypothetical protein